jgi:hypothetical protein
MIITPQPRAVTFPAKEKLTESWLKKPWFYDKWGRRLWELRQSSRVITAHTARYFAEYTANIIENKWGVK